jgi:hypothetical protein
MALAAISSTVTTGNRVRGLWSRRGKSTHVQSDTNVVVVVPTRVSDLDCAGSGPYNAPKKMRLYSGKIPTVGSDIVKSLVEAGDIEVSDRAEAEMDVQAVLKEYVRLDREITEKTKDVLQKRNLPYEQFGKVKRALAGEKGFGLGEEGLDWMTTQMIESFMQSQHIAEIFVDDAVLRKRMTDVLKKHMQVDEELDEEVRRRIKNLEEGTSTWEVEYGKVLDQIKRNRGLDQ